MANIEVLEAMVAPIVESLDADIYDLEFNGGVFRLTLDRPGGIDLETIAEATRQISRQIDLDDPIPGRFTLEVTSPGLERNLRTPHHWATAVGEPVRVKMSSTFDGDRRFEGVVMDVTDGAATVSVDGDLLICPFDDVERARTIFVWGPQPKPGGPKAASSKSGGSKSGGPRQTQAASPDAPILNESEVS